MLDPVDFGEVVERFVGELGIGSTLKDGEEDPAGFLIVVLAVLLPVALIWIGSIAVKSARIMREESERLAVSMDAMRQIYITQAQMLQLVTGCSVAVAMAFTPGCMSPAEGLSTLILNLYAFYLIYLFYDFYTKAYKKKKADKLEKKAA